MREKSSENISEENLEESSSWADLYSSPDQIASSLEAVFPRPVLGEGREDLKKPLYVYFNEKLRNSIEMHAKTMRLPLQEWIKQAVTRMLGYEQKNLLNKKLHK
jgi:hypothetical protein